METNKWWLFRHVCKYSRQKATAYQLFFWQWVFCLFCTIITRNRITVRPVWWSFFQRGGTEGGSYLGQDNFNFRSLVNYQKNFFDCYDRIKKIKSSRGNPSTQEKKWPRLLPSTLWVERKILLLNLGLPPYYPPLASFISFEAVRIFILTVSLTMSRKLE